MKRWFQLVTCFILFTALVLGAQAQEQKQKKQRKAKANAAQTDKAGKKGKGKGKKGQPKPKKELTAENIAQMEAAMPKEAAAKPKAPRKVLVFTLTKGFPHDSVPVAAKAMEMMGQKTGAWEATVSDNLDMFLPEKLNTFDAVIMDNTTGRYFFYPPTIKSKEDLAKLSPDQQKEAEEYAKKRQDALVAFVKGGKGLVGIHSATDMEYETWPEWGEMMGGLFNGHPWHCEVPIHIDLPDHPINKPFGGKDFKITDEIYQFKEPYSKDKVLELLSLGKDLPPSNTGSKPNRPDGDFAVSWVKKYGEGRVFYCSLGHDWPVFWNAPVLEHYLRGIQYALGDFSAPDDPKLNAK